VVGTHSAILFEGVKYTLTAASTASSLQDGQTLSFSGTVTPYRAGHEIYLERQNGAGTGGFHVVAVAMPQAAEPGQPASYTISHVVFGLGKQVYRVKVPGDPDNQGVASAPFTVEVTSAPPGSLQPGAQTPLPGEGTL
jgi:hypothetical protein